MGWRIAQMVSAVVLVWVLVVFDQGSQRAWATVQWALGAVLALCLAMKAYELYCSWSFGRKLSRMTPDEQAAEMQKVFDEARQLLKESKKEAEPASPAYRR
jgi:hypothetical protein